MNAESGSALLEFIRVAEFAERYGIFGNAVDLGRLPECFVIRKSEAISGGVAMVSWGDSSISWNLAYGFLRFGNSMGR